MRELGIEVIKTIKSVIVEIYKSIFKKKDL